MQKFLDRELKDSDWTIGSDHNKVTRRAGKAERRKELAAMSETEWRGPVADEDGLDEIEEINADLIHDGKRDTRRKERGGLRNDFGGKRTVQESLMVQYVRQNKPHWLGLVQAWANTGFIWTMIESDSLIMDLVARSKSSDWDEVMMEWSSGYFQAVTRMLTKDVTEYQLRLRKRTMKDGSLDGSYRVACASNLGLKDIASMAVAVSKGHILSFSGFVLAVLSRFMFNGINWAKSPIAFAVFADLHFAIEGTLANMLLRKADSQVLSSLLEYQAYYARFERAWNDIGYDWNEWIHKRRGIIGDEYMCELYAFMDERLESVWPHGLEHFIGVSMLAKPDTFKACRQVVKGDAADPVVQSRVAMLSKIFNVTVTDKPKSLLRSGIISKISDTKKHFGELSKLDSVKTTLIFEAARIGFDVTIIPTISKGELKGVVGDVVSVICGLMLTKAYADRVVDGKSGLICDWKNIDIGIDSFDEPDCDNWNGVAVIKALSPNRKTQLYVFGDIIAFEPA